MFSPNICILKVILYGSKNLNGRNFIFYCKVFSCYTYFVKSFNFIKGPVIFGNDNRCLNNMDYFCIKDLNLQ